MKEINYLKDGGKISLVAPSFGCTTEPYKTRLQVAINNFKKLGYEVDEGPNIFLAKHKARSNSAKKCAKEFMDAYLSDSDCVIAVGGGEIMCEILPYIDFKKLKKAPHKFFMGFSDPTNLTYTLATIAEIPTIYGDNAGSFAFYPFEYSTKDSFELITGKTKFTKGYPVWERYREKDVEPLQKANMSEKKVIRTYPRKDYFLLEGRLLGGNLDILSNLCGTKYDHTKEYIEKYKDDGIIWFVEACDLNVMSIRRALFQLKEAGWFKYVKGFLIGRPLCFGEKPFGISNYEACIEVLKDLHVPLLMDVDLGHFNPSMPIIKGVKAKVEYKEKNIFIYYE